MKVHIKLNFVNHLIEQMNINIFKIELYLICSNILGYIYSVMCLPYKYGYILIKNQFNIL